MTQTVAGFASHDEEAVRHDDRAHVFHSWSAQDLIDPLPIASAQGSYFNDYAGKSYLDFSSQLVNVNIGYQHPKLVAAIAEQAGRLCTIQPAFANDARSEAARLIAEVAPPGLEKVFFTNGGAEAIENAVRMARLHTGRHKVFAAYRSYHGATAGAISLTGDPRRWPSEPGIPGVVHYSGTVSLSFGFLLTERAGGVRPVPAASARPHHGRRTEVRCRNPPGDGRGDQRDSGPARRVTCRVCARSATSSAS